MRSNATLQLESTVSQRTVISAKRWSSRGAFALGDQVAISGANFLLNIFLATALGPSEYGSFAIAFSIFLLLSGAHNSLVLEPMVVIGPARYGGSIPGYLCAAQSIHWQLALAISAMLALAGLVWVTAGSSLVLAFLGLTIAAPLVLLFWFFRRACYLIDSPQLAFAGSCCYAMTLFAAAAILFRTRWILPATAVLAMGVASACGALILSRCLGVVLKVTPRLASGAPATSVLTEHWAYARWMLGVSVVSWLTNAAYLPLLGTLTGPQAAGALRASENLLLPMSQVLTAASLLLLPRISATVALERTSVKAIARQTSLMAGTVTAAYVAGLLPVGNRLAELFYGAAYQPWVRSLIPWLGAIYLVRAIADTGIGIPLRAAGRPQLVFWATAAGSIVTLTLGVFLVSRHGIQGAVEGWLISSLVQLAILVALVKRCE